MFTAQPISANDAPDGNLNLVGLVCEDYGGIVGFFAPQFIEHLVHRCNVAGAPLTPADEESRFRACWLTGADYGLFFGACRAGELVRIADGEACVGYMPAQYVDLIYLVLAVTNQGPAPGEAERVSGRAS